MQFPRSVRSGFFVGVTSHQSEVRSSVPCATRVNDDEPVPRARPPFPDLRSQGSLSRVTCPRTGRLRPRQRPYGLGRVGKRNAALGLLRLCSSTARRVRGALPTAASGLRGILPALLFRLFWAE